MKVMIFEPFHGGHYTNYLQALAEYGAAHPQMSREDTVLVISEAHRTSPAYDEQIAPYEDKVTIDASVASVPVCIGIGSALTRPRVIKPYMQSMKSIWNDFWSALERHQPDKVIIPSADHPSQAAILFASRAEKEKLRSMPIEAVFHYSFAGWAKKAQDRFKDVSYRWVWDQAPWSRKYFVNPMVTDWFEGRGVSSYQLCPDPNFDLMPLSREEAAAELGLDPSKSYMGFIGSMRDHAAIPFMTHGMRQADLPDDKVLLLAGRIHESHSGILEGAQDLIDAGKLVIRDQYLSTKELSAGYLVSDIVAPINRNHMNLSANVVTAMRAGKPVFASTEGYGAYMIDRFGIGRTVCIDSWDKAGAAFEDAFRFAETYTPDPRMDKVADFHRTDNFAGQLIHGDRPGDALRPIIGWTEIIGQSDRRIAA
ncbi:hypothetical protein [Parvularcula sp. LCG005]|uniref:hypothetical protein n=1 Tax=Parvularcula sp. LCG005 TaxID=3078805 RepID=UPI0029439F23|nr:hypothetical protein [Parvularcula sp. LCG005]WOI53775.1 hypothetical protein RUI03_01955 [Parvularcula sp. LCG005]